MALRPEDMQMTNQQKHELLELHGRTIINLRQLGVGTTWTYSHRPDQCVVNAYRAVWEKLGWSVQIDVLGKELRITVQVAERSLTKG